MLKSRRALTLIEVCIALTLGGLALSVVMSIGVRERRLHVALARRLASARQLRHASEILPIDLRGLDARTGDIPPGEARDTSIQLRTTVASGIVCGVAGTDLALVPATALDGALYSALSLPRVGDTLWALVDADTTDRWIASEILSVRTASGRCGATGATPFGASSGNVGSSVVLSLAQEPVALGIGVGSPVRATRPARYSIYRASDGAWYLGYRDGAPGGGFDVIQPVSGPYASRAALRFAYRDTSGALLNVPVDSTRDIAAVEIAIVADVGSVGAAIATTRRPNFTTTDSLTILVGLRNAR